MARHGLGLKIAAGSILVALSLVGLGWIHDANTRQLLEADRLVTHTHNVFEKLEATLSALKDAETGQRGYIVTGREAFLSPYNEAILEVGRHLEALRGLTAASDVQRERVRVLGTLADAKLRELAQTIALFRGGRTADALAIIETDVGNRTMETIRRAVAAIRDEEQGLLTRRSAEAERSAWRIRATSLAAGTLVLALLAVLLWVVRRDLVGRAAVEAQLRTTLTSIGDAVLATDSQGRVTFCNPVCERLMGWSSAEAHGRHVDEVFRIVNEETRTAVESPIHRVLRDRAVVGLTNHTVLISRDGREVPIADSGAPILNERGEILGVVLVFRDITDQRRAENAVQRVADIVSSSQHAIMGETLDGVITDWNPGAEALFGYSAEEMIGRRIRDLAPPGFEEPKVPLETVIGGGTPELEVRRVTKDGRTLDVAVTISAIRDSTGRLIGFSRIPRDVTERRRQREELIEARRRAEEANATKDRFLANLSHELRTPLTPIVASVHRLEQRPDLPEGIPESIAMIRRNVELEARLIDDLLDLTRIARGKLELHLAPMDVHELLRGVVQSSRSELLTKRLSIETRLDAAERFSEADAGRLQQVFWNLIRNAIKFTPSGGRITVSTENPEPGSIRMRVEDTGKGIEPDLLADIFDPFVQGDATAPRGAGGLGLGLAIARSLVSQHGGSITAASAGKGRGARFDVTLSTTPQRPVRASRAIKVAPSADGRSPVSVLVVEDDGDTAEAMRLLLDEAGFEVRVAGSVAAASETFRQRPADILVSDIGLPDGSGLDVLGRLRSFSPDLPGIVLSGYGMERDVAASRANGFAEHFTKPVNFDRLIAAIDRLAIREN